MESKLYQQQNAKMVSLAKPKHSISLAEKQKTWSNLLNKKSVSTNTTMPSKKKTKKDSSVFERNTKTINKSMQCDSSNNKFCQNSNPLSVFNPIRTLQFLLKEIKELPNVESIKHVVDEMEVVVERIIAEFSVNVNYSKFPSSVENDNSMIPTRENNCDKTEQNLFENKYWLILLGKISELEKNYTKSEEKLLSVTSERDKLLEQFKESCDSLEMLNNRERRYLDTIKELKSKLMTSDKLINKQEAIIIKLNTDLNNLADKKQEINAHFSNKPYKTILKENNDSKTNCYVTKSNEMINDMKDNEVFNDRTDIKQIKKVVLTELKNTNNQFVPMISLKPENNIIDLSKCSEDIECDINTKYTNYNRQASAIKLAKTELQQLFETIKMQAIHSKQLFSSTVVDDNEKDLSNISDEDDNHSNVSNLMSIVTNSSF